MSAWPSVRARFASDGSTPIRAWVTGSKRALILNARLRDAKRRKPSGGRQIPSTQRHNVCTNGKQNAWRWLLRLQMCLPISHRPHHACPHHSTGSHGRTHKTSSGLNVLIFLRNSADSSSARAKTGKTRDKRKWSILHENSAHYALRQKKTRPTEP